jgi:putative peptidoglycan lipid II flippase
LGVFGIAIATVILPNLSAHRAAAREDQFASTLDWAMRSVLLIGLPAALALILLAEPILITLFQYGALTPTDVDMASLSLRAYSLGLIAFMLIKILAPGYYARKDTATPVKIGIIAMAANMVMNLAFVLPLLWYFNVGHVGLALATSASAWLNAGLLLRGLLKQGVFTWQPGWGAYILRLFAATSAMTAAVLLLGEGADVWLDWNWQRRSLEILLVCGAGIAAYLLAHVLCGTRMRHLRAPGAV